MYHARQEKRKRLLELQKRLNESARSTAPLTDYDPSSDAIMFENLGGGMSKNPLYEGGEDPAYEEMRTVTISNPLFVPTKNPYEDVADKSPDGGE
jgi:hypothetical protein